FEHSLGGKWVELLSEISPTTTSMSLVFNAATAPFANKYISSAQEAAARLSIILRANSVENLAELERAIADLAAVPNDGLIVIPHIFAVIHQERIIKLASQHRVPAIYGFRTDDGLASYSADAVEQFQGAATYIDRIFAGARPSELPVQAPTKF